MCLTLQKTKMFNICCLEWNCLYSPLLLSFICQTFVKHSYPSLLTLILIPSLKVSQKCWDFWHLFCIQEIMISPVGDFPTLTANYSVPACGLSTCLQLCFFVFVPCLIGLTHGNEQVCDWNGVWVIGEESGRLSLLCFRIAIDPSHFLPVVCSVINNRIDSYTAHNSLTGIALLILPNNTAMILQNVKQMRRCIVCVWGEVWNNSSFLVLTSHIWELTIRSAFL